MKEKRLFDIIGQIDDGYIAEAAPENSESVKSAPRKFALNKWGRAAACVALAAGVCFGSFAMVAEAKEYETAMEFFDENDLSTEGLTRAEIKAVYRDITTQSFTYGKTAEVIMNSISSEAVEGYEISQSDPTPEDVAKLWERVGNYFTDNYSYQARESIHYRYRNEYESSSVKDDITEDMSYIQKYDGDKLIWSTPIPDFRIKGCTVVPDGVLVYGEIGKYYTIASGVIIKDSEHIWLAKVSSAGEVLWKKEVAAVYNNNSFINIVDVVENADGSYAIFTYEDGNCSRMMRYSISGEEISLIKLSLKGHRILDAARFEDGYVVRLGKRDEKDKIARLDREGNITETFTYESDDSHYSIMDMIEFNGKVYLSAYAVPICDSEHQSFGSRGEIDSILDYLFDKKKYEISSEELTPMVREKYTAILLACDPISGVALEVYSVDGSLGGELSLTESGELMWNVESITSTFFSLETSSFTIGGECSVYKYTFNKAGELLGQRKTDEITQYRR